MTEQIDVSNIADAQSAPAPGLSNPDDQWLEAKLSLRPELKFDIRNKSGGPEVIIEDPVRSKFFQVGIDEYRFIASLNGSATVAEITEVISLSHPGLIDEKMARTICQWLVSSNLVVGSELDNSSRLNKQAKAVSNQRLIGILNPICFKIRLFNPNKTLEAIQPYFQRVFSWAFATVWMFLAIMAITVVYTKWEAIGDAYVGILSGSRWIWLLIIWVLLKVIHEAAHGIACRKYGGEVPDAGVLILLFTPMAFVNVTSSWRFPNRWHRLVVAAAGMYVELFLSFIAIIAWANLEPGLLADLCFNVFVMACFTTILFNANPLMRFDGYFMLSDLLRIPNMYPKGTKWFGDRLKHLTLGTPLTPNICRPNEVRQVAIYGSMAFFWKILISLSLIIGSSVIFHGAGIVLAVMGVGLWFGIPLYKQFKLIFSKESTQPPNYRRIAVTVACLCMVFMSAFTILRGPATKSAPAIVQFKDELPLRADADGFVREILVEDGDEVSEGDILIRLDNPKLVTQVQELKLLANEAKIQTRIFQKTDEPAMAQAEQKKYESLLQQLSEKSEQAEGLLVKAPFDGFVFNRSLQNLLGSFVSRGDEMLAIAQRQTKEIVVSIDQADLESIKGNEGQLMRVAFPGQAVFKSELVRVDPKANDQPTHPTLCANVGGPLPVRQTSSDETSDAKMSCLHPVSPLNWKSNQALQTNCIPANEAEPSSQPIDNR